MEKSSHPFSTSSGDPRLDRRHGWAKAALDEGDASAAAELMEQTLTDAPHFAAAWHLYGQALARTGRSEEAAEAWRQCLTLDPDDHLGARLDLARIGALPATDAASTAFAGRLFDDYADRFDGHLVGSLRYTAPALLAEALSRAGPERFETVYDVGCGTGLMGEALEGIRGFLAGCDLSPRMIEKARAKRRSDGAPLYDKLAVAELSAFLASRPERSADLVVAADVFVYLGDLAPVFAQAWRVLRPEGRLAFTVQSHSGEGVVVGEDRRFAHARSYVDERLAAAGFAPVSVEACSAREDRGAPVPGLLVVARRA